MTSGKSQLFREVEHFPDSVQMAFAEDQEVIEALSPQAAEEALTEGVGPRCSIWRFQRLDC